MASAADVPGLTRLYVGSAVVPEVGTVILSTGESSMGFVFEALLGFHNFYSRALLSAAAGRLERAQR